MFRDQEYAERPNKTQLKELKQQHHQLGKTLVEMADSQLAHIPMSDRLRDAVVECKRLTKGALKRQLKFISGLMDEEDVDAMTQAVEKQKLPSQQETDAFHQLERWRDALLSGDKAVMSELINQFPQIDRQHLNQLVRNAIKEAKQNKPPKSARALFQYLKSL